MILAAPGKSDMRADFYKGGGPVASPGKRKNILEQYYPITKKRTTLAENGACALAD